MLIMNYNSPVCDSKALHTVMCNDPCKNFMKQLDAENNSVFSK